MSDWEASGQSDEWYTPKFVFDALGVDRFDLDVAAPPGGAPHVPAARVYHERGLDLEWSGFVWMNPPFGGRNGLVPWLDKFFQHGNGIAWTPDRTSAPWWQDAAKKADAILFISGKVKFERPGGVIGASPSTGTTLLASGFRGVAALERAAFVGFGYGVHNGRSLRRNTEMLSLAS
jgi:hypothetical protein